MSGALTLRVIATADQPPRRIAGRGPSPMVAELEALMEPYPPGKWVQIFEGDAKERGSLVAKIKHVRNRFDVRSAGAGVWVSRRSPDALTPTRRVPMTSSGRVGKPTAADEFASAYLAAGRSTEKAVAELGIPINAGYSLLHAARAKGLV